ncbi:MULTISPECIES: hypothetical protein [Providencia]|uniref:hypothetical protein n=1 Tax=Providencia TaxID=586 RepID=UPI000838B684|nr:MULTISPECIES: hypothetical protein [Providencia]MBP6122965.1 hypothetical protein [Providencia sp.]NIH23790.1 hypothetical protein [Providencia heimbachae]
MSKMNKAIQSVVDLHILIENVFTGSNGEESLKPLLSSFSDDFKMVTIQGNRIGLAEVTALFSQNVGKKPLLKITMHNITPLFESEDLCWIQYQEQQQTEGADTLRISVAGIKVENEECIWVYLHETPALINALSCS